MTRPLRIAFVGNFGPMCTEWETRHGFDALGHLVDSYQENEIAQWDELLERVDRYDLILWTRTRSYAEQAGDERQMRLGIRTARHAVPLVGIHADLWWGLKRERELHETYFEVIDVLFSADGAHDLEFAKMGIPHRWCLPAIAESRIGKVAGMPEYISPIAFVGSWQGGYHKEADRHELVAFLDREFGDRVKFWPRPGQERIWGNELSSLYGSIRIAVGDSANIKGSGFYCSDRIPNTLGRGCMLAHPYVEGINIAPDDPFFHEALVGWPRGDWKAAADMIEDCLALPQSFVDEITDDAVEFIRKNHTWTVRAQQILNQLEEMGLL